MSCIQVVVSRILLTSYTYIIIPSSDGVEPDTDLSVLSGIFLVRWAGQYLVSVDGTPLQIFGHASEDLSLNGDVYLLW